MQRIESWAPKEKPLNGWQREESWYANIDGLYLSELSNSDILTKGIDLQSSLFNVEMEYWKKKTPITETEGGLYERALHQITKISSLVVFKVVLKQWKGDQLFFILWISVCDNCVFSALMPQ